MKNTDFLADGNDDVEDLDSPKIRKAGAGSTTTSDKGSTQGASKG